MIKFDFEDKVEEYLRSEHQWLRPQRIQHAEYRRRNAQSDDERRFWNAVLKRMRD